MKTFLLIVGGIVTYGFVAAAIWGVTEPIWRWTCMHVHIPDDPEDFSELFAVFWPFWLALAPVVLVAVGPVIAGWKLRARMHESKMEKVREKKERLEQAQVKIDEAADDPLPSYHWVPEEIAGMKKSDILEALKLENSTPRNG